MTSTIEPGTSGLRFRLRDATAQSHRDLEAVMAIDDRCRDLGSYRDLLARMWGLYQPLEAVLFRAGVVAPIADAAARAKAGWLAQDLRALGLDPLQLAALPLATRLPPVTDAADAMGVLYVVEGASLGGKVIARWLSSRLAVTPESGGRFFASYGPRVGERWRSYVAALERFADPPALAARVERAAVDTFACFSDWMGAGVPIEEGARR